MIATLYFDGHLTGEGQQIATRENYLMADRCVGSVFEGLYPWDLVQLDEGIYALDQDLDLIPGSWRKLGEEGAEGSLKAHGFELIHWYEEFPGDVALDPPHPDAVKKLVGSSWRWIM